MKVLIADKFQDHGVGTLREAGCEVFVQPGLKDSALAEYEKVASKTFWDLFAVRKNRAKKWR